jgi:hypothetical protein
MWNQLFWSLSRSSYRFVLGDLKTDEQNFYGRASWAIHWKADLVGGLEPWNFMTFHILGISWIIVV